MAELYRKSSLERLSSPEQLDKLIVVTSPMVWLSVVGVALIIGVVTFWGFMGTLPDTVNISGTFIGNAQTIRVFSEASGKVEIIAQKDQVVKKDDLLARLDGQNIEKEIGRLEQEIQQISAITLDSIEDPASSTASQLFEIKLNMQANGLAVLQQNIQLDALEQQLEQKTKEEERLYEAYKETEVDFLANMGNDRFNRASFDYTQASTNLEFMGQQYNTAVNKQAEQWSRYLANKTTLEDQYGVQIPEQLPDVLPNPLPAWCNGIDPDQLNSLFHAYVFWKDARIKAENAEKNYQKASNKFENELDDYEDEFKSQNENKSDATALQNIFNEASQRYRTVVGEVTQLKNQILQTQVQITMEKISSTTQEGILRTQFEKTKEAILADLERELDKQLEAEKPLLIVAPQDGVITNVVMQTGQPISAGSEVFQIKTPLVDENINSGVVCFVPLVDAKKITPGMQVTITPTTVREQEYGHINGIVKAVATYNATPAEMKQILGDDLMVTGIQQQLGPTVKVVVSPTIDPNTASGFEWSNKNGDDVEITDGTMASLRVITHTKAPITKLLPYLKNLFAMNLDEE